MKKKVSFRRAVNSDSNILFEWINNRELVQFNAPFRKILRHEHDAWFARIQTQKDIEFFIIESVDTGQTIGSCQLLNISTIHRSAELQIRIGLNNFQNKGLGSDAVRQLVEFGFSELKLIRISLHVFTTNLRAIRVYEKNGFVREGLLQKAVKIDSQWNDVLSMARVRREDHD
jgi:RimJ/RimL family protein N-acetyltransferase